MSDPSYDVVIIGAGIAGATTAKTLADQGGLRILLVEAGRNTGMSADKYRSHVLAFQEALAKLPNSPYADNPNAPQPSEASLRQLVASPPSEPKAPVADTTGYFVQTGPLPFSSSYTRALGGTTLHWLGTCLRMLPNDFQLQSTYGHGADWPIDYAYLKPYYERAERDIIGVSGNVADQCYPGIGEDYFGDYEYPMERIPPSYVDQTLAAKIDGMTVPLPGSDHEHEIKVSSTPVGRNSTPRGDYRPVGAVGNATEGERCEGNSSCIPICPVQAKYNALKTLSELNRRHPGWKDPTSDRSSVTTLAQAVASKIELGPDGRVSGIVCKVYQDEGSAVHAEQTVRGRVYVLAANAIENAKLMLASGVANSSGQVGRNLMDHPLILTWGLLPQKVWSYRGPGSTSGIPAFRDGEFRKVHSAFRVEVGNWGWSFAANAPYSTFDTMVDGTAGLFGGALRQRMGEILPRQFRIAWEMEQIPEATNFVTIDPDYLDPLGNHRPVIRYDLPDYVRAGMAAAHGVARRVFDRLEMTPLGDEDPNAFPYPRDYTHYNSTDPGYLTFGGRGYTFQGAGHVAGTHRMGSSRLDSVVNDKQQSWDHDNLFMVGCGNMATVGTSNPTLTMTALAIAAGENIAEYLGSSR